MKKLNQKEMMNINGGALNWNGALLNSFIRYVNVFFEIGQAFGSAVRRKINNVYCKI